MVGSQAVSVQADTPTAQNKNTYESKIQDQFQNNNDMSQLNYGVKMTENVNCKGSLLNK